MKYAIAAGHWLTAQVAEDVLKEGGNAFDAAVAAYLTMFFSEPAMASIGAGGFANIYEHTGRNYILDFFCQTPLTKNPTSNFTKIEVDFGESMEYFYGGPSSMAVPGAPALIHYLVDHLGTMPLKELAEPAMQYSQEGIALTDFQAEDINLLKNVFGLQKAGRDIFFKDGKPKSTGDFLQMSAYADLLETFRREDRDWFYHGELSKKIINYSESNDGHLQALDFEKYQVKIRKPLHFAFQDLDVSVPDLPSMGGGLLYLFLTSLDKSSLINALSFEHIHALREAFAQCFQFMDDVKALDQKLSSSFQNRKQSDAQNGGTNGTSHFNIVDKLGNAISLSTSIGEGCGWFIPDTNMQMNNMLGETALLPNGLESWLPDRRLNSMMSPTMVFKDQKPVFITGSGGSIRIPFSIGQLLFNKYKLGLDTTEAIHHPRIFENREKLYMEEGFDLKDMNPQKSVKIWKQLELLFGGTHSIDLQKQLAVGDTRREGTGIVAL